MEVYLIRHTTPDVEKGVCYGQTDLEVLSLTFNNEVECIKQKLDDSLNIWYSSPLKRCLNLAHDFNNQPSIDERLKELDFGDWEMKNWNEIPQNDLQFWMDDFVNRPAAGGESYVNLYDRCQSFLEDLLHASHEKVAIVTHAGNIRAIMSYVLDMPLGNSFRIHLDYGAVVHLKLNQDKSQCQLISLK